LAKYDLAIIGSGPGGYVAAIRASQWGLKTVVIEKDSFLGGTCLHVGCIPTKVFLHHADIYDHFKRAEEFGFEVKDVKINWPAILARKDKIVKKHAGGIGALFKKNKVESITGWGRISAPGRISVEKDGKTTEIEATYTMLATGSEARSLPGVEIDGKVVLTNREILGLQEIPKSMIVVGCGAVGVEFASIFKTFGTDVTLLEALPRIVPLEDEDISAELLKILTKKGMRIELEAKVESVKKDANGATVAYKDKAGASKTISAQKVLIAVGRRPLTENIGLEKTKARSSADSFKPTRSSKPPSQNSTPSAISLPDSRSSRTPLRWKASSPSAAWRAKTFCRSTASAARIARTASRRSVRLAIRKSRRAKPAST
jgi:dihydrolipoamide dehydrogenase